MPDKKTTESKKPVWVVVAIVTILLTVLGVSMLLVGQQRTASASSINGYMVQEGVLYRLENEKTTEVYDFEQSVLAQGINGDDMLALLDDRTLIHLNVKTGEAEQVDQCDYLNTIISYKDSLVYLNPCNPDPIQQQVVLFKDGQKHGSYILRSETLAPAGVNHVAIADQETGSTQLATWVDDDWQRGEPIGNLSTVIGSSTNESGEELLWLSDRDHTERYIYNVATGKKTPGDLDVLKDAEGLVYAQYLSTPEGEVFYRITATRGFQTPSQYLVRGPEDPEIILDLGKEELIFTGDSDINSDGTILSVPVKDYLGEKQIVLFYDTKEGEVIFSVSGADNFTFSE
jgi:hypothetical protein